MKISLRRRHAPRFRNGASSRKIDYIIFQENLNLEGHQNRITGSGVTAIFMKLSDIFYLSVGYLLLLNVSYMMPDACYLKNDASCMMHEERCMMPNV